MTVMQQDLNRFLHEVRDMAKEDPDIEKNLHLWRRGFIMTDEVMEHMVRIKRGISG